MTEFYDEVSPEVRETIFREFNTLSVLYKKPSASFIAADHLIASVALPEPASTSLGQDDDRLLAGDDEVEIVGDGGIAAPVAGVASLQQPREVDLLGDDLLGLGLGGGGGAPPTSSVSPSAAALLPQAWMDPPTFQTKWGGLPVSTTWSLRATRLPSSPGEVEALAKAFGICTIASGDTGAAIKWFLFAQDLSKLYILMEAMLDKQTGALNVTVKADPGAAVSSAHSAFKQGMATFAS